MKHFKNFKLYEPDDKKLPTALYLRDENGNDWYSVIDGFTPDTFKISYRDDGLIIGCELDATGIFPVNLSVVEIAPADVPAELIPDGSWFYKDGELQQIRDYLADAETERNNRMAEVTTRIDWLEAAQKDGDISAEEETELAALRAYRTTLRRLDLTTAPDVKWPEYSVA
ncbi:tail fiber assembly protein [Citrobacter portucalensis]|uniref:tail fiber assembly protein n=1 Tax=Citrobacter portucalensis TaxID=1639133 RepID=UPI00202CDE07|nr:tail fiber assembly protein [Citrobacter portucalensis]URR14726.1 tail fiber assembly protein [Citrobacter portucalensis]